MNRRDLNNNVYWGTEAGIYPDTILNPIRENPTRAILAEHQRQSRGAALIVAGAVLIACSCLLLIVRAL